MRQAVSRNAHGFKHELDEHIEEMQKELNIRSGTGVGVNTLPRTALNHMNQLDSTMSMEEDETEVLRACEGPADAHCVIDSSASVDDAVDTLGRLRECLRDCGRAVLQVKDGGSSETLLDAVSLLHLLNQVRATLDQRRLVWNTLGMDVGIWKETDALFSVDGYYWSWN